MLASYYRQHLKLQQHILLECYRLKNSLSRGDEQSTGMAIRLVISNTIGAVALFIFPETQIAVHCGSTSLETIIFLDLKASVAK